MNVGEALEWSSRHLKAAGIATFRLDSLVLLEDCTGIDRAKLIAFPASNLDPTSEKIFRKQIKLRVKQLPIAYIRHKSEFYGREFYIDERVLEPRPESETLIDELKLLASYHSDTFSVLDIGTGSGALIITAKLELPNIDAYGLDLSQDCLNVARRNAKKYTDDITFLKSDLLKEATKLKLNQTILLANLPYVPSGWQINPPAMREPAMAIYGGKNGLSLYEQLFEQSNHLKIINWIITESMPPQHEALAKIALEHSFREVRDNDFIQVFSRY